MQVRRFSVEAFKFIGENPFVFIHCLMRICNASDPNSRCAKGCQQEIRRRRDIADSRNVYNLAQGPFVRTQEKEEDLGKSEQLGVPETSEFIAVFFWFLIRPDVRALSLFYLVDINVSLFVI